MKETAMFIHREKSILRTIYGWHASVIIKTNLYFLATNISLSKPRYLLITAKLLSVVNVSLPMMAWGDAKHVTETGFRINLLFLQIWHTILGLTASS